MPTLRATPSSRARCGPMTSPMPTRTNDGRRTEATRPSASGTPRHPAGMTVGGRREGGGGRRARGVIDPDPRRPPQQPLPEPHRAGLSAGHRPGSHRKHAPLRAHVRRGDHRRPRPGRPRLRRPARRDDRRRKSPTQDPALGVAGRPGLLIAAGLAITATATLTHPASGGAQPVLGQPHRTRHPHHPPATGPHPHSGRTTGRMGDIAHPARDRVERGPRPRRLLGRDLAVEPGQRAPHGLHPRPARDPPRACRSARCHGRAELRRKPYGGRASLRPDKHDLASLDFLTQAAHVGNDVDRGSGARKRSSWHPVSRRCTQGFSAISGRAIASWSRTSPTRRPGGCSPNCCPSGTAFRRRSSTPATSRRCGRRSGRTSGWCLWRRSPTPRRR